MEQSFSIEQLSLLDCDKSNVMSHIDRNLEIKSCSDVSHVVWI